MTLLRDRLPGPAPHSDDFTSPLRSATVTARIGVWLGISFGICFVTGLVSHWLQHPPWFFLWPTRPVALYRWTQGVHVLSGIVAIPLLGAKLWTVFPKLFARFDFGSARQAAITVVERGSILVLVGAGIFELLTGLFNIAHFYPWGFFFPPAHYAMAWVAIGALVVHIAVKLPVIRAALGAPVGAEVDASAVSATSTGPVPVHDPRPSTSGPSRRTFLRATWASAGVVLLATAGMTVPALRKVSVLAVRNGEGPQGVPVNKTATGAGVVDAATDPGWTLTVRGPAGERAFTRDELAALPQTTETLPIACVEGWSASAEWTGVAVGELVAAVGGSDGADVRFTSIETGLYGSSVLPARHARSPLSLVALQVNGQTLDLDHGFPARLIAPSRPGVTQTKWLTTVEVL